MGVALEKSPGGPLKATTGCDASPPPHPSAKNIVSPRHFLPGANKIPIPEQKMRLIPIPMQKKEKEIDSDAKT